MESKFCKTCGAPVLESERFCSNCGTTVNFGTVSDYQPTFAVQQFADCQPKKSTSFKNLYIPAKVLAVISLVCSICDIIMAFCVMIISAFAPYLKSTGFTFKFSGIASAGINFYVIYYIAVAFAIAISALIMSIISIKLGGKIKRQDPLDPGANVASPAKVALVFTIIALIVLTFCIILVFSNDSITFEGAIREIESKYF